MKQFEKEFAAFAKAKAEALGPGLDWEKPEAGSGLLRRMGLSDSSPRLRVEPPKSPAPRNLLTNEVPEVSSHEPIPPLPINQPATVTTKSSDKVNYWTLLEQAVKLVSEKNWQAAKAPLKTLIELYPDQSGPNNAYAMLATVHRGLNETAEERVALEQWASRESDALDAYSRLMELDQSAKDWQAVSQNAERFLAVNPLIPLPYRSLALASEELGETNQAITAYQKLLLLDPPDPADVHFHLAQLLRMNNNPAAKRQVLQALEEAPRFREAHRLLLELAQASPTSTNTSVEPKR